MTRKAFLARGERLHSAAHRRSRQQELELAKVSGGVPTPGSGSGYQKGDVKKAFGIIRIEAKTTKRKSFAVTREMVRKIEEAAMPNDEIPAIVVEFVDEDGRPEMEVAVVPTYVLPKLGKDYAYQDSQEDD